MDDSNFAGAARHALIHLENERELRRNPLLAAGHGLSHDALRAAVLRALDALRPYRSDASDRGFRRHAIVARCDLGGETHKGVMDALGLSRRQFYRERREALILLGTAMAQAFEHARAVTATLDLGDAAEAYIEALRSAGENAGVWREASALAAATAGQPREIDAWMVASEAARFLADGEASAHALACAREAGCEIEAQWRDTWIASGEMNLHWVEADCAGARAALQRRLRDALPERALHGKEAILLGIVLANAAAIELDCGRWQDARDLVARAWRSIDREFTGKRRQSMLRLSSVLLRLSALLADYDDGDRGRSLAEQRGALEAARATGQLGNVATSAVHYGDALRGDDPHEAARYAGYGLEIARHFYPGDRLAELTLIATPALVAAAQSERARSAVRDARRPGIGLRDELFLDLAEVKIAMAAGDELPAAADRAEELAARFFRHGVNAWACDARLLAVEAAARLGHRTRARRQLAADFGATSAARAETRRRARRLGTLLALPA